MTSPQPPAVATWLLARVCSDPGLCGDLVEEYRLRGSAWYWKQALIAVSVFPFSQIREHKWLAARAIVLGYAIWYLFNEMLLRGVVRPWLDMGDGTGRAMYFALMYVFWLANGWIIAKLHRPYATAMVLAYVLWAFVASVPPVYTLVLSTLDGATNGSTLAWTVATRGAVLFTLMSGGVLAVYRDQLKRTRTAAQNWPRESPRALAG